MPTPQVELQRKEKKKIEGREHEKKKLVSGSTQVKRSEKEKCRGTTNTEKKI